jgi:CRP-like cAMP-binding protein
VTFERGDLICKAGVTADALYILRTGRVAISQRTGATLKTFRYRGPGDVIGEMGLFAPRRARTATVSASTRVEAWRVDYEALESAPNAAELTAVLAERYAIRRAEARIAQHPLFASLDLAARSELLSAIRSAPGWVPAGTSLAAHRSVCGGVFFLLDGAADVVLAGPDSREFARVRRETTDRTSELLGLDVLAGVRLWPYGLVTTSRSCVVTIPIEAMLRVLDENLMNQFPTFILGRALTADAA